MKNWVAYIKLEFVNQGIEAKNKAEAINVLKELYKEQYGIELNNSEIIDIKQEKGE